MGMVLWVNVKSDDKLHSNQDDLLYLYKFANSLDRFCKKNGLAPFSGLFDYTDMEINIGRKEMPENVDSTDQVMLKSGQWSDFKTTLQHLSTLSEKLTHNPQKFGLISDKYSDILDELNDTLKWLEQFKTDESKGTARFVNFAVIM